MVNNYPNEYWNQQKKRVKNTLPPDLADLTKYKLRCLIKFKSQEI